MNIIDIIFILIIIMCSLFGVFKGVIRETVSFVGFYLVVILSFMLKNPVSVFFYKNLPFFKFFGIFKGIEVLNILIYEIIAFIVILSILTIIFGIIVKFTKIFEKLLTITIVLGIPSKILGGIVGIVEGFVLGFIMLYIVSLPVFDLSIVKDSKIKDPVLKNTPFLSSFTSDFVSAINDFTDLKEKYESDNISSDEFNKDALNVFINYKIIDKESVKLLSDKNKLTFKGMNEIIGSE